MQYHTRYLRPPIVSKQRPTGMAVGDHMSRLGDPRGVGANRTAYLTKTARVHSPSIAKQVLAPEPRPLMLASERFINCGDLVLIMMSYCDAGDLKHRLCCVASQYFQNAQKLLDILRTCDAVVSGSTALRLLLPEIGTPWTPKDLDIYVPLATSRLLLDRLQYEGYTIHSQIQTDVVNYTYSHVHGVVVASTALHGERRSTILQSG